VKRLLDRRILVVGASAGIGRASAVVLGGEGARVALLARREDRLAEAAQEVPGGALALPGDLRDPQVCERSVARAAEALGGLDALVYAAGIAALCPLADADAETWRESLEVNLVAASLVTRAALPHLSRSRGRAVYLSSITALDHPPRRGIPLYVVSKTALDKLVDLWQQEHREIGFTRVSVGDTGATEMGRGWEPEAGGRVVREWIGRGLMFGRAMEPEAVARHVADLLACDEVVAVSRIVPRYRAD
jgi:NAD(P)-dependent dehydrogenase (short-subunit alcohol dehydrogenase family)